MTQDLFRHLRAHTSGEKNMDMKQLDARQELLVITMEECGELIQACSKALRRGELFAYSDTETQLKQEIADVYAMIELMQDWDVISWDEIERGVERKRNKLKRWSKLINDADEQLRKGYSAGISMTAPPKSEQKEKNFPSNSVTWRQSSSVDERGYGKVTYNKEYSGSFVDTTPMSPEEDREWNRMYERQKNIKSE